MRWGEQAATEHKLYGKLVQPQGLSLSQKEECSASSVIICISRLVVTGRVLARAGLPEPWGFQGRRDYGGGKQGRMTLFGRHSTLYRFVNRQKHMRTSGKNTGKRPGNNR